ncbi:MAG: hypothetical protein HFE97_06635 [Oscillospiraceae bacterium]|nr:hypothetical protein [Oscillospiraceae bacterium]
MQTIDIARRCAQLGVTADACNAFTLALHQGGLDPEERLEAAVYLLRMGGDYKVAYTQFNQLYHEGQFKAECLDIMTDAFYTPNIKLMKTRYEKNCAALAKYPYLFQTNFPKFEDLPLHFYPFDDNGYLPFDLAGQKFGEYINFNHPVISRNFFKDLENPILAQDVYSQYELEYLYDNVRPSEDIGRENHLYLHYASWETFCAHLQVLNIRRILEKKKIVFLFGQEISRYPIDFKAEYGVDYSQYPVKPIGVQDVQRLIWHTQLSSDNGGDFFNEVFDNHPNLLCMPSVMLDDIEEVIQSYKSEFDRADKLRTSGTTGISFNNKLAEKLYWSGSRSDKDILTTVFLSQDTYIGGLDHATRIYPALFFQPHFSNIDYDLFPDEKGRTTLTSDQYDRIRNSSVFKAFKYIKTFSPLRRVTTSYAATIRWQVEKRSHVKELDGKMVVTSDLTVDRVANRSFMIDPEDRLFKDSVLVRFEDGKTNPRATFTALAAFLDLPYTESMTYCSEKGVHDVETAEGNVVGFDTATVYRTYDEYATDEERAYIEFCLRDAYQFYGYDFHYYDGGSVDEKQLEEWMKGFTNINGRIATSWRNNVLSDDKFGVSVEGEHVSKEVDETVRQKILDQICKKNDTIRLRIGKAMIDGLYFINKNGQPLRMMPKLELDPALLDQPLYH